jgi:nucleotide-binding universal stress UspA family protein
MSAPSGTSVADGHSLKGVYRDSVEELASIRTGDPLFEIVEHARTGHVDLIVMGTHGRTGVSHLFLGSVAERVVRTATCPVLTVR